MRIVKFFLLCCFGFVAACSISRNLSTVNKIEIPKDAIKAKIVAEDHDTITVFVTEKANEYLQQFYQLPYIKRIYDTLERYPAPFLCLPSMDFSEYKCTELVELKYEILARRGYFFKNKNLRHEFLYATDWYKPIWPRSDSDTVIIAIFPSDYKLLKKIQAEIEKRTLSGDDCSRF